MTRISPSNSEVSPPANDIHRTMKTTKKTKAKKPEHVRLGTLPTTRSWKDVVGLVADGEGVEAVATRALTASGKAFVSIQNDAGFSEAVWVLTQLAVAAQASEPHAHLEAIGLKLAAQSSVADVAACLHETLDRSLSKRRERSDFGEMAQSALVSAVSQHLNDKLGTLVAPTADDVHRSLAQLGRATEFGRLSRSFFARLAGDCMDYFLSKSLGAEVGAGRRFVTTAQMAEFEGAMATHAFEAAKIVEQFSGEWMSKHRFEGEGRIGRGEADRFGWYALEKVRAEMKARTPLATSEATNQQSMEGLRRSTG